MKTETPCLAPQEHGCYTLLHYRGFTIRVIPSGVDGWKSVWFDTRSPAIGKRGQTSARTGRMAPQRALAAAKGMIDDYRDGRVYQDFFAQEATNAGPVRP